LLKLWRLLTRHAYRHALLSWHVAATIEHRTQPFTESFRTVIDIGSNRGQFAVFARDRWPSAKLLCFEPLPGPRDTLVKVANHLGNVEIFPYALSASSRVQWMHVSRSDDSSSLLRTAARQVEAFPNSVQVQETEVEVRRLDDMVSPADLPGPVLMKIDVQGAELDVIRGATGVLDGVHEMLVECSLAELYEGQALLDDVIIFAREQGFRVTGVLASSAKPNGPPLQCDVLFSRT
jgi:FkbM family methyltransferase